MAEIQNLDKSPFVLIGVPILGALIGAAAPLLVVLLSRKDTATKAKQEPTKKFVRSGYSGYYEIAHHNGTYKGNFVNDKCNGQGTYNWTDDGQYVGNWKNDRMHGLGIRTWKDGRQYLGNWKGGKMRGQGTHIWANEDKYVGNWKDNKMNGQGIYTWADSGQYGGNWYDGNWKDDKMNGQGTRIWTNGEKYVGNWVGGLREGYGTYYNSDGTILQQGQWKNDKFVG